MFLRRLRRRRVLSAGGAELDALDAWARGESPAPEPPPAPAAEPPPGGWFPCPCCGHQTFGAQGEYEICEVCYWEDDATQLRFPLCPFGPNHLPLVEAQAGFRRIGAVEERCVRHVRPPAADEPLDPGWRPIDLTRDSFEDLGGDNAPWPENPSVLYWWRPTFWRRDHEPTGRPGGAK